MGVEEQFWQRAQQGDGCWEWTGSLDRKGYGKLGGRLAHRVAYELIVGPIPGDLTIDHLCRVKSCVNPTHMEPVTRAENNRRRNLSQTHCRHGHEFTPENTRMHLGKWRICRACDRRRSMEYLNRKVAS